MALTSSITTQNQHYRRGEASKSVDTHVIQRADYFRWKVALDLAIACLLLIPVSIMIAILVLLVCMTSRGPGIYQQIRVGKHGRRFMIYKIRTMRVNAEAASGPVWTQSGDPRVTFLGVLLRKLHLDELPQLFNVLRGEMSFVGPRPERPEFVRVLSETVPRYRDRLLVRPGITGLAQINLPPDSDLMSVRRKVALDLDYIGHGNLWLDVRLLLCTALRVFKVPEGFLVWILDLQRPEPLAAINASGEACSGPEEATPGTILLQAAQASMSNGAPRKDFQPVTSHKPR
ncbi:MAG: sugar transferase [Planctomycetota bacterium]